MAGLYWMAVVLAFFLSAENSLAAVDQNWLTSTIEAIKNEYALGETFSLAVNAPQDPNNLQQVFQDDPADKVKQAVSGGQVYKGTRVVASSGPVSTVLENIEPFIKSSQGNFLIIYSEESPCGTTCTNANDDGIAAKINDVTQNWGGYAFVFSKVVDVPDADASQLSQSFKQLGISKLGLDNIFRCYKPGDDPFQCTSCSSGGDVTPSCVANNAVSNQEQGGGEEIAPTQAIPTDTGGGTGGGSKGKGKGGRVSKCKGRGSRKRGCRRGKGGRVKNNASVEEAANAEAAASVEKAARLGSGANVARVKNGVSFEEAVKVKKGARVKNGVSLEKGAEAKVNEGARLKEEARRDGD
ncbi:uncharacterized protein LOC119898291 [Micropterus salmoides]|uniref:uncharacterized protein LOC119898291 n=1 Tax=Micropterus salmoides TaxID=27706 RepID=UPI0018EBDD5D|nr:uncharacterized protein LOC119898291 [Micropterus salmoides]